jgi:cytochrome c-type biogenesis protein CcmE
MNQIDYARFWVVAALIVGIAVAILILLAACETPLRTII